MLQDNLQALALNLPEDIQNAKGCGDFERALRLIDIRLADIRTPKCVQTRLLVEKEILQRLPLDYTFTPEQAVEFVRQDIPDFTLEELNELMDQGAIDWLYIHGAPYLAARFYETLLKVNPFIARRAGKEGDFEALPGTILLNNNMAKMQEMGGVRRHIHMRASLRIKDEYFRPGQRVRVHLPIPASAVNMQNIEIISTSPTAVVTSPANHPQRTVFFEETLQENHPFTVEYAFDCVAMHQTLDPQRAVNAPTEFDTGEELPHIQFTPVIRALCAELKGDEENPLKIARLFYDFCTTIVKYSFMRQYFTLTQIPEYAALNLKGDCGVQALLFITLCRCAGIPARWQSGLYVTPDSAGPHDWAQFYVAPYGWLFADPSFGGSAYRNGNLDRWNHYFGNLDPFRMVANSMFQHRIDPLKFQSRLDPYDNQVGEAEYDDCGLQRSHIDCSWEILEHSEKDI